MEARSGRAKRRLDYHQIALARSKESGVCLMFEVTSKTGSRMVEAWAWTSPYKAHGRWVIDVRWELEWFFGVPMEKVVVWKPRKLKSSQR